MAEEKNIDTRICLKYDLLSAWEKDGADLELKPGEAVVAFDSDTDTHRMKIGDGKRTFKELPWANGVMPGTGEKAEVFNGLAPDHASGESSHAEGANSFATGKGSHAEGADTGASAEYSHAEGYHTHAAANNSHAEGQVTIASGVGAHAEGSDTQAEAHYSHAEGVGTIASTQQGAHAEGTFNDESVYSDENEPAISTIGNGFYDFTTGVLKRSNAFVARKSGLIEGGLNGEEFSNKINAGRVNEKVLTPVGWVNTRLQSLISQISEKTGAEEVNRLIEEYISDLSSSHIVEMHPNAPDNILTLANNTLYVVQCYDSYGDLADMELIKSNGDRITTKFAIALTASDFQGWPLNELVLYQVSVVQGYVKSTNNIVAIAPTTTNRLLYWTISGSIFNVGSGITVEANPSASAQTPLTKLRVDNTVYSIPQGGGGTEVEANPATTATAGLTKLKVGNTTYSVVDPTSDQEINGIKIFNNSLECYGDEPAVFAGGEGVSIIARDSVCCCTNGMYTFYSGRQILQQTPSGEDVTVLQLPFATGTLPVITNEYETASPLVQSTILGTAADYTTASRGVFLLEHPDYCKIEFRCADRKTILRARTLPVGTSECTLTLPEKDGTLALTSDVVIKSATLDDDGTLNITI